MAEVAAPTRTPRMPTADFGAASSAWGMSNIQAGGMEEEQEEWPSLAGGGREHFNASLQDKMAAISRTIFLCLFFNKKFCILIKISLNFGPKGPTDNNLALV